MTIWGRRDGESPAEEAHESQAGAYDTHEPAAENQAGEPGPAFWRAQGEAPTSAGRDPADAPPPAYEQATGEAPAPAVSESPAGTDAPVPVLTGVVVPDAETAAEPQQPYVPGAGESAAAEAHEPAVTGFEQPVVTEAEPAVTSVDEPAVTGAEQPVVTEAEPSVTGVDEPAVTGFEQPAAAEAGGPAAANGQEAAATGAPEPAVTGTEQPAVPVAASSADAAAAPASSGIPPQRWSEILVAFVDDPRGSVQMAAEAVDSAIDEFVNSIRARQHDLASTWQGGDAGTEQFRTALLEYRKLGQRVQHLDLGERAGA